MTVVIAFAAGCVSGFLWAPIVEWRLNRWPRVGGISGCQLPRRQLPRHPKKPTDHGRRDGQADLGKRRTHGHGGGDPGRCSSPASWPVTVGRSPAGSRQWGRQA